MGLTDLLSLCAWQLGSKLQNTLSEGCCHAGDLLHRGDAGFDSFLRRGQPARTSFAIGPGETVLGQIVEHRHVHSVNSLKAATGLNPKRLYRLMLKAGMIPADTNDEALNQ